MASFACLYINLFHPYLLLEDDIVFKSNERSEDSYIGLADFFLFYVFRESL